MNDKDQPSTELLTRRPFVHPTADIRGSVAIGRGSWIGPNVRLHADHGRIVIGENTTLEADCVIHAHPNRPTNIGASVTIRERVYIEDATIQDEAVIGEGCILPSGAVVGESALLGAGTAPAPGQVIPDCAIVAGHHGHVLRKRLDRRWRSRPNAADARRGHDSENGPFCVLTGHQSAGRCGEYSTEFSSCGELLGLRIASRT